MRIGLVMAGVAVAALAGCAGGSVRRPSFRLSYRDVMNDEFTTQPQYFESLGAAYWGEERYDDARDAYMSALRLEYGESFDGQVAMGQLYEREGNMNRAVAHYARAASIRPGHLAGWYHLRRVKRNMTITPDGQLPDGYNPRTMGAAAGDEADAGADDEG